MGLITAILDCLTGGADQHDEPIKEKGYAKYTDTETRSTQAIATDVMNALLSAEKKGRDLERTLQNIVGEYGWTENIAKAILDALEKVLKNAAPMAQAMKDAFDKATSAAVDFAREHPVYCTIIALGILVILAPWVIEALGFGELGPIEGKCGFHRRTENGEVVLTPGT